MFKNFLKFWLPLIIWAGLIFYLSSVPYLSSGLDKFWDIILRKIGHAFVFCILFLLLARALLQKKNIKFSVDNVLKLAIVFSVFYAISDEIHQRFTLGRSCALADVCIDSAGVMVGYLVKITNCKYQIKTWEHGNMGTWEHENMGTWEH